MIAVDTPVRVRMGRGAEREATIVEDRGSRYRVRFEDGTTDTVLHERVRAINVRKPPVRVEPIIPPPLSVHAAAPALRAVPKPAKPLRDSSYLEWTRTHPCRVADDGASSPCSGSVVAHHHGPRGMGEKTDDYRAVPLCDGHHREFHATGTIGEWTRDALDRAFARWTVYALVAQFGHDHADLFIDALVGALRERER